MTAPHGARSRGRRAGAVALTVLAALLLYLALAAPKEFDQLGVAAVARIPVEALLGVALLLVLPGRARLPVAVVGGALVGVLTLLRVLDMGFLAVLDRPFDLMLDWTLLGNARDFLDEAYGRAGATAVAVTLAVLAVALVALTALAGLRVGRLVDRHRTGAARAAAALGVVWLACLALGAQIVAPVPVAARSAAALTWEKGKQVPESVRDGRLFAEEAAVDAFRGTPPGELLTGLRGKDVLLTFVESYGRSAVEDPQYAPRIGAVLDDATARLAAAGFSARSGWLTSPVSGGSSWLAHATAVSGVKVGNQQRYRSLVASDRLTLSRAFQQGGWETTVVMPATFYPWPEGAYFGFDRVLDNAGMAYRGPNFSFSPMPDQYTLAEFERRERGRTDRGPLFAQLELTSSHVPFTPYPTAVPWEAVGDGSIFAPQVLGAEDGETVYRDQARARVAYREATAYSLETVLSYVERFGDDRTVLVYLGDHQPQPQITGENASSDVPVTIVAKDPAVLDRVAAWDWDAGLRPSPAAPVWPMEAFRDRFMTAFGTAPTTQ